jgi:serine/threonine protein kinase
LNSGSISRREAIHIATTLVKVLARVHARGIVHRNLTPDNVLVTPEGTVTLIGFGLAAPIHPDTSPGRIAGDMHLVGQLLTRLWSQTQGPPSEMVQRIIYRCTLQPPHGGYGGASLLAEDLERCAE